MTIPQLLGPIAAATMLNVFAFALLWRQHISELRGQRVPGWLYIVTTLYFAAPTVFVWARSQSGNPATGLDLLAVAILAQATGCGAVYALLHGLIYSRGEPFKERAFPLLGGLFLAFIFFAGVFSQL